MLKPFEEAYLKLLQKVEEGENVISMQYEVSIHSKIQESSDTIDGELTPLPVKSETESTKLTFTR